MSPSTPDSNNIVSRQTRRRGLGKLYLLATLAVLLVLALAGCGGDQKGPAKRDKGVVLAKVGATDIWSQYYEDRLSMLKREELPADEYGQPLDMSTPAGKDKFLEVLINKEVMSQTATALGYENDANVVGARSSIASYEAGLALWAKEIEEPANLITEEQLQAFYEKMGSVRHCRYLIANFLDTAEEARAMALSGADWADVVDKYHDGEPDQTGKYEIGVPFGRYKPAFENAVFGIEIGDVTEPIETIYGYWVLVVDSEKAGDKPPLEEAKAKILDTTRSRVMSQSREDFKAGLRKKYKFFLAEDALWKCFLGLPAGEDLFYPGTKDAVRSEDLLPLDVATEDMELPFYGYKKSDGTEERFTLGDYKIHFDKMSVFQRPKHSAMLGGLRSKITGEMDKIFVDFGARDLGYFDDEIVVLKVDAKIEELLVNKLYNETVTYDSQVTPEQLEAFWAAHHSEYDMPETRNGAMVVCLDETTAEKARAAALNGVAWGDVLVRFGSDADNKSRAGKLTNVRMDGTGVIQDALRELNIGEMSTPVALGDGRYIVLKLDSVTAPHETELASITEDVGKRMKQIREEEAFQAALKNWKQDIPIVTYPENMSDLKSWLELTTPVAVGPPVERKQ